LERLRHIREQAGLSQPELSEISGVAQGTISDIELGKRKPRGRTLRKLAQVLGVEVADLIGESEVPPKAQASLWEAQQHEGLLRSYRAAAAFGRTVVESFKNFKPLDMQRLGAFHQLESGLLMLGGKRDLLGKLPDDLADAVDELAEVSMLVNERLHEHLDTSPPKEREKFERELRELTERIKA
jgi:transcriptional regulator with XRE-family HTH domain